MPRQKNVPYYGHHKPSGQARMILNGKHVYLGPYGSAESRSAYARIISENFRPGAGDLLDPAPASVPFALISINELFVRYNSFAESYYVKDGEPTSEVRNMQDAMKAARALYGLTPAHDFGPLRLKAVRQHMMEQGNLCRSVINKRVNRLRRIFRWAVGEELVPPSVLEGLRAVEGLRRGRCTAYDPEPIGPVDDRWVDTTCEFTSPQVADMIRLQRLTGLRPGNIVKLRWIDIDRSGAIWVFRPASHKTQHLGKSLTIPFGPKAQLILKNYATRQPHLPIFSPAESEAQRRGSHRPNPDRKTPLYPSEKRRVAHEKKACRKRTRLRPPCAGYTTSSYARAISYAILKAKSAGTEIVHWHPNQLRHSRATEIRRMYGLEGAQLAMGHTKADVTQIYAERDLAKAIEIARMTG